MCRTVWLETRTVQLLKQGRDRRKNTEEQANRPDSLAYSPDSPAGSRMNRLPSKPLGYVNLFFIVLGHQAGQTEKHLGQSG